MTDSLSRRRFLRGAATTITAASTMGLVACGSDDDDNTPAAPETPAPAPDPAPVVQFLHGVASGDPLADRVILWTRAATASTTAFDVLWEMSADEQFSSLVAQGTTTTSDQRDYTVKVDASGLTADTVYWYRFRCGEVVSPVGRTRTLPVGDVSQVKMAVFSCANYPAGYFHVYADAAKRNDLDVALHLGDYVYEYARDGYASEQAASLGRDSEPVNEIVTLADYRIRHGQYRSDASLQALHAKVPFIVIWDDHELANDAWMNGAENHQPDTEGNYADRRAAAIQAYHEWLPTREQAQADRIYRRFDFGNLVTLHMADTRLQGREEQLSYSNYFADLLGNPDPAAGLNAFLTKFAADAGRTDRQLLGQEQQQWLQDGLAASNSTWQVLGQQVLMGPVHLPMPVLLGLLSAAGQLGDVTLPPAFAVSPMAYVTLLQRAAAGDPTLTASERQTLALPCLPYNLDSWDGHWAAREAILSTARTLDKNLVVLAGDTHNAWASDLRDLSGAAVGVELATSSVSSPGFEVYLGRGYDPAQLSQLVRMLANLNTLPAANRWAGSLRFSDTSKRGYIVVTATPEAVESEWHFVDTVVERSYTSSVGQRTRTLPGAANRRLIVST